MLTLKFVSIDFIVTLDILDETKYYLDFCLILYPVSTVATYVLSYPVRLKSITINIDKMCIVELKIDFVGSCNVCTNLEQNMRMPYR